MKRRMISGRVLQTKEDCQLFAVKIGLGGRYLCVHHVGGKRKH